MNLQASRNVLPKSQSCNFAMFLLHFNHFSQSSVAILNASEVWIETVVWLQWVSLLQQLGAFAGFTEFLLAEEFLHLRVLVQSVFSQNHFQMAHHVFGFEIC